MSTSKTYVRAAKTMADEEHPRKRVRLEDETPENEAEASEGANHARLSQSAVRQKAAEDQLEQESRFGVTAFVSRTPGFSCILKQRFTDFLVNETDLSGKVAHLEAPVKIKKDDAKTVPEKAEVKKQDEEPKEQKPSEPASKTENEASHTISPEILAELESIFGKDTVVAMQDLYSKILAQPDRKPRDLPQHTSEPIQDKQQRTDAHVAVRRAFQGRIETVTGDDNRIMIKAGAAPRKGYRQLPQRGDGPITKGKVGWDELGGEYLHFTLYKENKDTMEVLYFIASQMKMHVKNFQFAGTKDRRGVTAQRVSAYRVTKERLEGFNSKLRGARLSSFEYRKEGLQLGDLQGNEFTIALRECEVLGQSTATSENDFDQAISSAVSAFRVNGYINYYGLQRFGSYNVSTDEVGKRMLQGDLKGAVDGILAYSDELLDPREGNGVHGSKVSQDDLLRAEAIDAWNKTHKTGKAVDKLPRKFSAENALIRHLGFVNRGSGRQERLEDWQGALMQIPRNLRLMYVHAYQSLVWNVAAGRRHELYGGKVVEGDLVIINKNDSTNGNDAKEDVDDEGEVIIRPSGEDSATAVEDKFERARPLSREEAESGKYTIFDIVMPQPGYDVEYPANAVGEFYKEFMAKQQLDPHNMRRKWRDISLSGSYRKVYLRPEKVSYEVRHYTQDDEQLILTDMDRLNGKTDLELQDAGNGERKRALIVRMQLGSSQYATMALRELTKGGALAFKPDYSGR